MDKRFNGVLIEFFGVLIVTCIFVYMLIVSLDGVNAVKYIGYALLILLTMFLSIFVLPYIILILVSLYGILLEKLFNDNSTMIELSELPVVCTIVNMYNSLYTNIGVEGTIGWTAIAIVIVPALVLFLACTLAFTLNSSIKDDVLLNSKSEVKSMIVLEVVGILSSLVLSLVIIYVVTLLVSFI